MYRVVLRSIIVMVPLLASQPTRAEYGVWVDGQNMRSPYMRNLWSIHAAHRAYQILPDISQRLSPSKRGKRSLFLVSRSMERAGCGEFSGQPDC